MKEELIEGRKDGRRKNWRKEVKKAVKKRERTGRKDEEGKAGRKN